MQGYQQPANRPPYEGQEYGAANETVRSANVVVGPFNGIFNDQALGRSVFETSTIIAMLVYALIGWGIVSLGRVIFAPNLPSRQSVTTTRRNRV